MRSGAERDPWQTAKLTAAWACVYEWLMVCVAVHDV